MTFVASASAKLLDWVTVQKWHDDWNDVQPISRQHSVGSMWWSLTPQLSVRKDNFSRKERPSPSSSLKPQINYV